MGELTGAELSLREIAVSIQFWLDYQENQYLEEGMPVTDDTHFRQFPVYPTRGQLKAWIDILVASKEPANPVDAIRKAGGA